MLSPDPSKPSQPPKIQLLTASGGYRCARRTLQVPFPMALGCIMRGEQSNCHLGQNRRIWTRGRGSSEAPEVLESCLFITALILGPARVPHSLLQQHTHTLAK